MRVVVLTGAGISAASGIATYRDSGGLWEGVAFEDVATPEAWARDPAFVWRFYQLRRAQLGDVEPNAAHHALVRLGDAVEAGGGTFTLITQNVDDLHQRAGSRVLDMHGQLRRLRCERCGAKVVDTEHHDPDTFVACEACGHSRMRPDVTWFGEVPEHLPAIEAAMVDVDVFLAIGTSGAVWPAAGLLQAARAQGAATFVLALDEPDNLHPQDTWLRGGAVDVLPAQVDAWIEAWS